VLAEAGTTLELDADSVAASLFEEIRRVV